MPARADSESVFTGVKPVDERHRFDEARLTAWMADNVAGFSGPISVQQFKGGQSNPTFQVDTPGHNYVLRRKPLGKLLPSAHAVDREFKVISGLYPTGFPVARPCGLCTDESVLGSTFYIMDKVEGRIFWNGALPELLAGERRPIYEAEIATLARLHEIDPASVGLGDFGKPGNYFARQIDRWTRQYRASETSRIESIEHLIDWLPRSVPVQERVSIVHGDYRIDNMIFDKASPHVVAVLDWELSTLGDPLADFTYFIMQWIMPAEGRSGLDGLDLASLGIPAMDEAVALYCQLTNRHEMPDLNWYFAYNLFRLACILQGIAGRVRDGTASSSRALEAASRTEPLATVAWDFAKKSGA